jgi:hypothetical protein
LSSDVFDGYAVEIRYLVLVERGEPPTYKEVTQTFALRDNDPAFAFELPEAHELALERDLDISVTNRSHVEVAKEAVLLARVIRQDRPIELRIANIEPPPVVTPIGLRGRLAWRSDPSRVDGFTGFKVIASVNARDVDSAGASYTPRAAVADITTGNAFDLALPNRELLDEGAVSVEAKYPDGKTAALTSFTQTRSREPVVIEVDPQQGIVVKTDTRVDDVKVEKLKGKVVDLQGKVQVGNKQVIVWAQNAAGAARPVLVAVTDGYGNFSGDRPKERNAGAIATVAGTLNDKVETGLPVKLVELSDGSPSLGLLPRFIYLVVSLPAAGADDEDCACDTSKTPRLPDAEDLVNNSGSYSQDIGLNCVNFTTPNRTLEEFTYTLVVRTTDPDIKGTTLSDIDRRTATS